MGDPVRRADQVSGQVAPGVRPVVTDAPVHRRDTRSSGRVVVDLAVGLRLGDGTKAAPPVRLGDVAETLSTVSEPDLTTGDRVAKLRAGAYRRVERAGLNLA